MTLVASSTQSFERQTAPPATVRVLVVDDSAFMRKMVSEILAADPTITVIGQARDGADALLKIESLKPDVVTMDIEMPVLDGISALTEVMKRFPTPVVMLSSLTQAGAEATMRCLEIGAVDFIGKPSGMISLDIAKVGGELIAKVKAVACAKVNLRRPTTSACRDQIVARTTVRARVSVIAIGSSTGGPRALQQIIPLLPADLGVPIVVVQHMPAGFTASLASRLQTSSHFAAKEAVDGDRLKPGQILVAPGGQHLMFDSGGVARLTDEPPVHSVRPAIDVTFLSLAGLFGSGIVAVLLTGMGKDGARALKQVSDHGGMTIAEDETTCVVYGMPKAAVELGAVRSLLPLNEIASAIGQYCRRTD